MRHALWALLALPLLAAADGALTNGSVIDGYTYRDGYYWQGNQAYEKYKDWWQESVHYRTPYYHYKYEWRWKWAYSPVAVAQPYLPPLPKVPKAPDGWKEQALESLARQQENVSYMEVFKLLGGNAAPYANGVPHTQGYAYGVGASAVLSGNTAYVRTTQTKADYYGTAADIGAQALLFGQQFGILSQQAQVNADKAVSSYAELNARHQKIVGILADAEAFRIRQEAINKVQPSINIRTQTTEPFIPANPNNPGILPKPNMQAFGELVGNKCGACHGADPAKLSGGFDLRDWPNFDAARKAKVFARVTMDPANPKRMPPPPAPPLTNEEKAAFLSN